MITYIALGSNLGDSEKYIHCAIKKIEEKVGKVIKKSTIIKTKPYGYEEQPDFLNAVIEVDTDLLPKQLLNELKQIEKELDRIKTFRWGPRTIDLDIILYENVVIDEENLHIPHKDFMNRSFVLGPLTEIAKGLINPRTNEKILY